MINKDLTGLWLGKKKISGTVRLGGCWGESQSLGSCQPDAEEAGRVENEVTRHESCGRI